jgi:hypothetical protein
MVISIDLIPINIHLKFVHQLLLKIKIHLTLEHHTDTQKRTRLYQKFTLFR